MYINSINPIMGSFVKPQQDKVEKRETNNYMTVSSFESKRVSAEMALAPFAPILTGHKNIAQKAENNNTNAFQPSFGGGKKPKDTVNEWIKNLPFADDLSPQDRRNLGNVIRKNDEETAYMKKMIHLICKNEVNPMATAFLCKHGKMSELAKADIDTYYDKIKGQGMSKKDAFVPVHASQAKGQEETAVGDVFRVDGQDKIFIKSGDNYSRQLDMDADTYLKLYPPVERYASSQGENGDCYLLSSINAIMENPYARPALLDCFHQVGKDVMVQFPGKDTQVVFPNGKLPIGADYGKYTDGPTGMKLLEYTYGKTFEADKYAEYKQVVADEMKKMEKELHEKWEKKNPKDSLTIKKKKELNDRMANWQAGQAKVDEAMADPNHKMLFVLDDLDNFVIGKFGPMTENVDKVDKEYKVPSDYYTGGVGGYTDFAIRMLGFEAENYEVGVDDEEINEALFAENPQNYIIAGGTYSEEEGEMESPQEVAYSIYSSHAYKIEPFDNDEGTRMFKVTNPWNQSHRVIMDVEKLREYFADISIAEVNPNA